MRNLIRIFFALVLLFTAATCFGQTKSRPKRKTTKAEDEIRLPAVRVGKGSIAPEPEWTKAVGAATVRYYRDRNKTTVAAVGEGYRQPPIQIQLLCDFEVKGEGVVRPEAVKVTALSNALVLAENAGLVIEAGGERFAFKPDTAGCDGRKCSNATAAVDFATFERIASSASVVIHAAPYTFTLNEHARAALRDVVRAVESAPKKP